MMKSDWIHKGLLAVIAICLMVLVARSGGSFGTVYASQAQFDHIDVVSAAFIYNGRPGLLLLDRRNGNVWYLSNNQGVFGEPVYLTRVPFEKLDQGPPR